MCEVDYGFHLGDECLSYLDKGIDLGYDRVYSKKEYKNIKDQPVYYKQPPHKPKPEQIVEDWFNGGIPF